MMPNKPYLFFLTDDTGSCYYLQNGIVQSVSISAVPATVVPWLPEAPDGWIDTEVSFIRNTKYYGINRTFVPPLKFAGDGAAIIRNLFYGGLGIEANIFFVVTKFNPQTNIYEAYYRGELDLTKLDDSVADFCTVSVLESGILKYLKANENTVYSIPCDGSLPEHIKIKMDGMILDNISRFAMINIDVSNNSTNNFFIPATVFLSSDGQSPNVRVNGQNLEDAIWPPTNSTQDYYVNSTNWTYSSAVPSTPRIKGQIIFTCTKNDINAKMRLYFRTPLTQFTPVDIYNPGTPLEVNKQVTVDFDVTLSLAANEHVFLGAVYFGFPTGAQEVAVKFQDANFEIDYSDQYQQTECWAFKPFDLYKRLVSLVTEGKYTGTSSLLQRFAQLACTSGLAVRQIAKADIKTSLTDFWNSFNPILNAAIGIGPDGITLFFEAKAFVFDPTAIDMDLGEVSGMKTAVQVPYFFNNLKIGYPNNDYDSSNGLNEYNTTAQWGAPITKVQQDLLLISKYRADSYGIEFTRILTPGNNTVNNKSDNDVFILNIDLSSADPITDTVSFVGSLSMMVVTAGDMFRTGQVIQITGSAFNNGIYTVTGVGSILFFGFVVFLSGGVITDEIGVPVVITITTGIIYKLRREAYSSITGIAHPETAYNIEDLTPKRMLLKWGNYLRGVLYNRIDKLLSFLSIDKNKNLSTTLDGVTIVEATDVTIGNLDGPLFYPITVTFKTKVPLTFEQILTNAANAHIQWSYNGKTFYGFPMALSVKPTLDEAQDWTMLLSPRTNLANLINLDVSGLAFLDVNDQTMFIPFLSPVQFVKLGAVLPPQYHFKNMTEWWYSEQVTFYVSQPRYSQKWQNNDVIKMQVQTNGLGPVQADLINCHGEVVRTVAFSIKTDPAIIAPLVLFEGNMVLTGHEEGNYYILITAGTGGTVSQAISEPLHIAADHPLTLLLEYSGTRNKQSTIFSTGYNPSFRFEGWLDGFGPKGLFATYVDQPADIQLLNGIPYRAHKLNVGNEYGVPDYIADKVNRIMLIGIGNKTYVDGVQMSRDESANLEAVTTPGTPLKYWTLDVRESVNADGIVVPVTPGGDPAELTVEYNIQTKAFGDGSPDGIVQIIEVE